MLSVQKDEKRERRVEEPCRGLGRFHFIPTRRAQSQLLHLLGLKCVVISTLPFVLLYLFITALVWTINLTRLPTETGLCSCQRDACLSPSDLRNAPRLQTDTRVELRLVSLAKIVSAYMNRKSSCFKLVTNVAA